MALNWKEIFDDWREQFKAEHGFYPEEDPELRKKGFTKEESLAEHMSAAEWGAKFAAKEGRPPNEWEWKARWYKRYEGGIPWHMRGDRRRRSTGGTPSYVIDEYNRRLEEIYRELKNRYITPTPRF